MTSKRNKTRQQGQSVSEMQTGQVEAETQTNIADLKTCRAAFEKQKARLSKREEAAVEKGSKRKVTAGVPVALVPNLKLPN